MPRRSSPVPLVDLRELTDEDWASVRHSAHSGLNARLHNGLVLTAAQSRDLLVELDLIWAELTDHMREELTGSSKPFGSTWRALDRRGLVMLDANARWSTTPLARAMFNKWRSPSKRSAIEEISRRQNPLEIEQMSRLWFTELTAQDWAAVPPSAAAGEALRLHNGRTLSADECQAVLRDLDDMWKSLTPPRKEWLVELAGGDAVNVDRGHARVLVGLVGLGLAMRWRMPDLDMGFVKGWRYSISPLGRAVLVQVKKVDS